MNPVDPNTFAHLRKTREFFFNTTIVGSAKQLSANF